MCVFYKGRIKFLISELVLNSAIIPKVEVQFTEHFEEA